MEVDGRDTQTTWNQPHKSSPYHPQSNGMLECWHATVKAMLRKSRKGKKNWDRMISLRVEKLSMTPPA